MCFVINKDYAGELKMANDISMVGEPENSPAGIADRVAVQNSGARNVLVNGLGSASVETALAPHPMEVSRMNAKAKMVEIVGSCIDKVLKAKSTQEVDLTNESERIDICMDVCDEILRIIENPEFKNGGKDASQ